MAFGIRMRRVATLVAGLALALVLALVPRVAYARSYSIDRVDIDATVGTDGALAVSEAREFDFDGEFHGVYWKIPTGSGSYRGREVTTTIGFVGEYVNDEFVAFTEGYDGDEHTYELNDHGSYIEVKLYSAHEDEAATFGVGYTYTNVVARHDDVAELYWKFVSDGWDEESRNVTCTVHLPVPQGTQVLLGENVRAWGHGPLDATVGAEGNDVVYRVPGVGTSEFAEARITFIPDWLSDAPSQGGRVLPTILEEEQQWADEANARRERARLITYGGAGISLVGTLATMLGSLFAFLRYRLTHRPHFDDDYYRDVPTDDHPAVLGALYRGGDPANEDFTATLMRLTDLGAVKLDLVTIEERKMLGRVKTREDYRLTVNPKAADMKLDKIDRNALVAFFDQIGRFAPKRGDADGPESVCFGDLEKIAKKHPGQFDRAYGLWEGAVNAQVAKRRFFKSDRSTGRGLAIACATGAVALFMATVFLLVFSEAWALCVPLILAQVVSCILGFAVAASCKSVSDEAIEVTAQLKALRRWLKDFTRLKEAVPRDVVLWNRLLVMAVVLGVADEVIKQLKMTVPELLEDPYLAPTYAWYYGGPHGQPYRSFNTSYGEAHSVSTAALAESSSSSGGGGGGGFSGGGGGGFGGGGGGGAF